MAYGRNDRNRGGRDGANQRFIVERPKVFQRAAAAGQQHGIVALGFRGAGKHGADFLRRAGTLHGHRQYVDLQQRKAARQHAKDIAHRRAGGRSDDGEAANETRQGTLAIGSEQSFRRQFLLECFEGHAQCTFAGLFHVFEHELVFATCFVQGDAAPHQHQRAVAWRKTQVHRLLLEQRAADLGAVVLQREVQVARRGTGKIADFALHPDLGKAALQQVARQRVELRRFQDGAFANQFSHGAILPALRAGRRRQSLSGSQRPSSHRSRSGRRRCTCRWRWAGYRCQCWW